MMATTTGATLGDETRQAGAPRGRLGRYARWQLEDFVRLRAPIMIVLALVFCVPLMLPQRGAPFGTADVRYDLAHQLFSSMATAVAAIGALLSVRGVVSEDRQYGYHRFLFAKPVSMPRYYAQAFGIQFVGFLATLAAIFATYSIFVTSVPVLSALAAASLLFALFGGLGFFFSTLVRADWLFVLLLTAVSAGVVGLSQFYPWLSVITAVLPPVEALGRLIGSLLGARAELRDPAVLDVLRVYGYGVVAFLAGLGIIRRRSITA